MNVFTFTGNLGKDAVLRQTQDGRPVLNFSVAVKTGFKESDKDMWVGCAIFGKRAESLQQYLTKGTKVAVSGSCKLREWQDNDGRTRTNLDVVANEVTLLGSTDRREEYSDGDGVEDAGYDGGAATFEDDIPFAPYMKGQVV